MRADDGLSVMVQFSGGAVDDPSGRPCLERLRAPPAGWPEGWLPPDVQLTVGADNNVFIGGIADFINGPVGLGIGVLPGMQVYGYSLQDSTGRYLLDYDFTKQPVTGPVLYDGAVLV